MRFKTYQMVLAGVVSATAALPAMAEHEYNDRARVLSVTPQVQRVNTPSQQCHTEYVRETVYESRQRSNTGAIVGGVAGGLVGSRFGGGNGRIVTAAIGAGLGAIVGDRIDNNRQPVREYVQDRPVERCTTVDRWDTVTTGYLVNYEYNGRQYSTLTDHDPGRFIPVNVEVQPSGYVTQVVYSQGQAYGGRFNHDNRFNKDKGRGKGQHKQRDRQYW
ncbi:MAG TPA: glycine zipper 2TM domain-containing protein [Methylophilus sp.]